jgi:hypothetical protein
MSSNIEVKLDVLNQKGSPALFASSLATRPAASFEGRLFVDSDNPSTGVYRDTGSAWIQIADAGAGTSGTLQQVTTNGNTSNVGISVTANGIGIGTTIPATNRIDIHAASGIQATFNGTGTTNSALQLQSAGVGKWNVTNKYNSAANDFAITDVLNSLDRLTIKNNGNVGIGISTPAYKLDVIGQIAANNNIRSTDGNVTTIMSFGASTGSTGTLSDHDYIFVRNNLEAGRFTTNNSFGVNCTPSGIGVVINAYGGLSTNSSIIAEGNLGNSFICMLSSATPTIPSTIFAKEGIRFAIATDKNATGFSEKMRMSPSGNFSIGNTNDTYRLDVEGNAKINGSILINNTVTAAVAVASTHKVTILIGGVTYYLLATNI